MADQMVIILQGLPGAGKSTWAAAWRDAAPQLREVVNRDQIRFELFGVYSGLSAEQEAVVSDIDLCSGRQEGPPCRVGAAHGPLRNVRPLRAGLDGAE